MHLAEEKKEAERIAKAGQIKPPAEHEVRVMDRTTIAHRTKADKDVPVPLPPAASTDIPSPPLPSPKYRMRLNSTYSYSNYSEDSSPRRSPVFGRSRAGKSFDFGKSAANSDEEEDVIETAAYRTQCAKKLVEAENPSPEIKGRRISVSKANSPLSPMSPNLRGANRRLSCVASLPMLDSSRPIGFRAASTETIGTEIFQPSPLPGQIRPIAPESPFARTNSDSFMPLASVAEKPSFAKLTSDSFMPLASVAERPSTVSAAMSKERVPAATAQLASPVENAPKAAAPESRSDWLRNYKCSMRKCVSPITEGWKRPDGGMLPSGRMMAIFDTGFYIVGEC